MKASTSFEFSFFPCSNALPFYVHLSLNYVTTLGSTSLFYHFTFAFLCYSMIYTVNKLYQLSTCFIINNYIIKINGESIFVVVLAACQQVTACKVIIIPQTNTWTLRQNLMGLCCTIKDTLSATFLKLINKRSLGRHLFLMPQVLGFSFSLHTEVYDCLGKGVNIKMWLKAVELCCFWPYYHCNIITITTTDTDKDNVSVDFSREQYSLVAKMHLSQTGMTPKHEKTKISLKNLRNKNKF